MKTLDELVKTHYNTWIENAKKFISEDDVYDVVDGIVLSLYERPQFTISEADIDKYINGAAKISYWSSNSPYNRELENHIQYTELDDAQNVSFQPEIVEDDDDLIRAHNLVEYINGLKDISWWEKQCFLRKVLEDKTFREMADELNCTIGQVFYSYRKVKNYLAKKLENYYE